MAHCEYPFYDSDYNYDINEYWKTFDKKISKNANITHQYKACNSYSMVYTFWMESYYFWCNKYSKTLFLHKVGSNYFCWKKLRRGLIIS